MDEDSVGDRWVIGTWHVYYHVELHCVVRRDGKPCPEYAPTSQLFDFATWRSYHAARKYRDAHPQFEGYEILNLDAMKRQCKGVRDRERAERVE